MGSGNDTCIKCLTLFSNSIFALTGLMIFTVGITAQLKYSHYSNFVSGEIWTVPIILMVVGAAITIGCILGCCGVFKESICMILFFTIVLLLVFFTEIGLGIAGYLRHTDLKRLMENQFNTTLEHYNEREHYRDAWTLLQSELNCCGSFGPEDWQTVFKNDTLPPSCCSVINLSEAQECTIKHANKEGCFTTLFNILDSKALTLAGVALGVAAIQLLTIMMGCCLYRSFRRSYHAV